MKDKIREVFDCYVYDPFLAKEVPEVAKYMGENLDDAYIYVLIYKYGPVVYCGDNGHIAYLRWNDKIRVITANSLEAIKVKIDLL